MTLRALDQQCRNCGATAAAAAEAICGTCLGPLGPVWASRRALPGRATLEARPHSLWRYREWLPFEGEPEISTDIGWTPLVESPTLAARLGLGHCWLKLDSHSFPSLSFKDRVVATALNAARALGLTTVGCASTGNLANAVAAQAARAGLPAWVFIPADLERGKVAATAVHGARLVRVTGTYDDVNRLCAQVADHFGWGVVNVNLRGYYGEGSKTMAFEIAEQLGWRVPDAVVAPMAGGSLVTKLDLGFAEFREAGLVAGARPKVFGAQAAGCAPIVRLYERGEGSLIPEVPNTIARSIAIGNPADGPRAARVLRESGGAGVAVSDAELVDGILLLAETAGVFTETAGGVTVAAARRLAQDGRLGPDDDVVLCITGNGLKTVEALASVLPDPAPIPARLGAVAALVDHVTPQEV